MLRFKSDVSERFGLAHFSMALPAITFGHGTYLKM